MFPLTSGTFDWIEHALREGPDPGAPRGGPVNRAPREASCAGYTLNPHLELQHDYQGALTTSRRCRETYGRISTTPREHVAALPSCGGGRCPPSTAPAASQELIQALWRLEPLTGEALAADGGTGKGARGNLPPPAAHPSARVPG